MEKQKMEGKSGIDHKMLKIDDMCQLLRVSKTTLKTLRDQGKLPPHIQISSRIFLWQTDQVNEWLKGNYST